MSLEPKIIDHPGAGKIQEMTLDQYLSALSPDHLARKQLDEIRGQALKAVEFSTQLMQANEKIMDLQNKLILDIAPQPIVPSPNIYGPDPLGQWFPPTNPNITINTPSAQDLAIKAGIVSAPPPAPKPEAPKAACPVCGKVVTTSPGGWASHQRMHPDNKAPRPTV